MAEYISRTVLEEWGTCIAKRNDNQELIPRIGIHLLPTADVIERTEYEFIRHQLVETMDRVAELDKINTELRSKIDKAIAEINAEINQNIDSDGIPNAYAYCYQNALEILKRNIGE